MGRDTRLYLRTAATAFDLAYSFIIDKNFHAGKYKPDSHYVLVDFENKLGTFQKIIDGILTDVKECPNEQDIADCLYKITADAASMGRITVAFLTMNRIIAEYYPNDEIFAHKALLVFKNFLMTECVEWLTEKGGWKIYNKPHQKAIRPLFLRALLDCSVGNHLSQWIVL